MGPAVPKPWWFVAQGSPTQWGLDRISRSRKRNNSLYVASADIKIGCARRRGQRTDSLCTSRGVSTRLNAAAAVRRAKPTIIGAYILHLAAPAAVAIIDV